MSEEIAKQIKDCIEQAKAIEDKNERDEYVKQCTENVKKKMLTA